MTLVTLTLKQPQLLTLDRVGGVFLSIRQEPSGGSPGSHRTWGSLHLSGVKSSIRAGVVGAAAFGTLGGGGPLGTPPAAPPPGSGLFSAVAAVVQQRLGGGAGGRAGKTGTGGGGALGSDPPQLWGPRNRDGGPG